MTPVENYAGEMAYWSEAIEQSFPTGEVRLLDLGSGGGHHLYHLDRAYRMLATDVSAPMLELCRSLNPSVETAELDMTHFSLESQFEVVTVHDSLTYLTTEQQLRDLFGCIFRHLVEGGVVLFAPDHFRDTFDGPYADLTRNLEDDLDLSVVHYEYDPDPEDQVFTTDYTFFQYGPEGLEKHHEVQELGIFDRDQWRQITAQAGFTLEELPYKVGEDDDAILFRARK